MRKLVHEVRLRFFQDNANGSWGTAMEKTLDSRMGDSFNAFWDGEGLFHDVFEHSQEFEHEWFRNDAALNVGGEMWAMGAMMYYGMTLGMQRFPTRNVWTGLDETALNTTYELVSEAIRSGHCTFGYTLVSHVPRQKDTGDYNLESMLNEYVYRSSKLRPDSRREEERDYGRDYRKSVKAQKIRDLHRAGWRWARKLVPHNHYNREVLEDFIEFWQKYTKRNPADELAVWFRYLDFKLFVDDEDGLSWEANLIRDYPNDPLPEDYVLPETHFSSIAIKRQEQENDLSSSPETANLPLS